MHLRVPLTYFLYQSAISLEEKTRQRARKIRREQTVPQYLLVSHDVVITGQYVICVMLAVTIPPLAL